MLFESVAISMISKSLHARVSGLRGGGVGQSRQGKVLRATVLLYQVHDVDKVFDRLVCVVATAVSFPFDFNLGHLRVVLCLTIFSMTSWSSTPLDSPASTLSEDCVKGEASCIPEMWA